MWSRGGLTGARRSLISPPGRISSSLRESSSLVYADEKLDQDSLTLISPAKHTMKRKLNSEDVPEVVMAEGGEEQAATASKATFASLNLDARLLQAITKEKFTEPTAVQAEAVPLALSGKDILGTSSDSVEHIFKD